MATTTVIPTTTFQAGSRPFGPTIIQPAISSVTLELDRTEWHDPALQIALQLDLSLDGGATWASENPGPATNPFPVALTAVGGDLVDKFGNPITKTTLGVNPIPGSGQPGRRIRGTLTNTIAFTTSGILVTA